MKGLYEFGELHISAPQLRRMAIKERVMLQMLKSNHSVVPSIRRGQWNSTSGLSAYFDDVIFFPVSMCTATACLLIDVISKYSCCLLSRLVGRVGWSMWSGSSNRGFIDLSRSKSKRSAAARLWSIASNYTPFALSRVFRWFVRSEGGEKQWMVVNSLHAGITTSGLELHNSEHLQRTFARLDKKPVADLPQIEGSEREDEGLSDW